MRDRTRRLDCALGVLDRLAVFARVQQRPGEVRVRLRAAGAVPDPFELFDRAKVAVDGVGVQAALELDESEVSEAIPDLLDAPGPLSELEAPAQCGRRLVEIVPLPVGIAEQPQRGDKTADVVGVLEDPLRLELVLESSVEAPLQRLGTRELQQELPDHGIAAAGDRDECRL
jgi:hypothetical protein